LQSFWNGVPEQPTSALQVSDFWHKLKGHIGPNLAFLYGGHYLGRRATKISLIFIKGDIHNILIFKMCGLANYRQKNYRKTMLFSIVCIA
jgi:hypothetical protein